VVCVGGTVLSTAYYLAAIPLIPSLVGNHPVLLEAIAGTPPAMAAAGAFVRVGRVSPLSAIAAPLIGLSAYPPFFWWAGRRYGNALTTVVARRARAEQEVERALRIYRRHGGWTLLFASYLPVPNPVLYAAAGWSGFSFPRFAVLGLIGTMLRIVPAVALGYALGDHAVRVAGLLSRCSIAATMVLIVGLIGVAWWRNGHCRMAARRAPGQAADAVGHVGFVRAAILAVARRGWLGPR